MRRARRAGSATSGSRRELVDHPARPVEACPAAGRRAENPALAIDDDGAARQDAVVAVERTAEGVEHGERRSAEAVEDSASLGMVGCVAALAGDADEIAIVQQRE